MRERGFRVPIKGLGFSSAWLLIRLAMLVHPCPGIQQCVKPLQPMVGEVEARVKRVIEGY